MHGIATVANTVPDGGLTVVQVTKSAGTLITFRPAAPAPLSDPSARFGSRLIRACAVMNPDLEASTTALCYAEADDKLSKAIVSF